MKESLFKIMCHTDTSDSGKSSKRALFQVDSLIDKEGEMQKMSKNWTFHTKTLESLLCLN